MLKSKSSIQKLSVKMGIVFSRVPLSPNQWTVLSLLPAFIGFCFIVFGHVLLALFFFCIACLIDAIDGSVARVMGRTSKFGAYLDGMIDRFIEALILFGLMIYGYPKWIVPGWLWLAAMLFFGTCMTSFARAYADHRKVVTDEEQLRKMGGILERAERLMLIFLSMIMLSINPSYATYILAFGVILAFVTVLQRIWAVAKLRKD